MKFNHSPILKHLQPSPFSSSVTFLIFPSLLLILSSHIPWQCLIAVLSANLSQKRTISSLNAVHPPTEECRCAGPRVRNRFLDSRPRELDRTPLSTVDQQDGGGQPVVNSLKTIFLHLLFQLLSTGILGAMAFLYLCVCLCLSLV